VDEVVEDATVHVVVEETAAAPFTALSLLEEVGVEALIEVAEVDIEDLGIVEVVMAEVGDMEIVEDVESVEDEEDVEDVVALALRQSTGNICYI
jgi:hypothetical protein